ncbi:SagF family protein [Streptococcus castoreus]|uniref:SagF family protein n=1 Tax=Streptococcus castoreus TaxID=254786 RepID=UPI00040F70E0|nr:SagF family protein [Streptococcus castoreus]
MMIAALLTILSLITLWLTSHRRRRLVRWHFKWIRALSYQDWLDVLLSVIQFGVVALVLLWHSAEFTLEELLSFLGHLSWQWQLLCYMVLYLLALIEMTLLVLVLLFDFVLQKDSRLLFKKLTWLAFKKDRPMTSLLVISLITVVDSIFYFGLLVFLGTRTPISVLLLVLGYALVKACRYSGWLNWLLAFCLFAVIGLWAVTATLLYGWLASLLLLTLTYLMISFKEQQ